MRIIFNSFRADEPGKALPAAPMAFHRTLDGYAVTPLLSAPGIAAKLGVRSVLVKDESNRFGMPAFKILGASWAIYRLLCERLRVNPEQLVPLAQMRDELTRSRPLELVAATDGNHGRAVARMAALLGLSSHILVPDDMVPARRQGISDEGARLTVVKGTYDEAVRRSAELADDDHLVISDTAWPGYDDVPRWVIDGYSTIGHEVDLQIAALGASAPTVIAAQIGVGAFAASMIQYGRQYPGTIIIGVEPSGAACTLASIAAGHLVQVPGPHQSIMAGLNCGSASPVAWPIVSRGLDVIVAIDDSWARAAMRLLAADGVVSGESGAAGLAGLLAGCDELDLPASSSVLIVSTEGATDPAAYAGIVSD